MLGVGHGKTGTGRNEEDLLFHCFGLLNTSGPAGRIPELVFLKGWLTITCVKITQRSLWNSVDSRAPPIPTASVSAGLRWDPGICIFASTPGESNSPWNLRTANVNKSWVVHSTSMTTLNLSTLSDFSYYCLSGESFSPSISAWRNPATLSRPSSNTTSFVAPSLLSGLCLQTAGIAHEARRWGTGWYQ